MDVRDVNQKFSYWTAKIAEYVSVLLWKFMHFLVTIWLLIWNLADMLESFLVSHGLLTTYKSIDVSKLRYLAIVVESEEARKISSVIELLQWVAAIGVKHVCLYDMEGVLKESKEEIIAKCNARPWKEAQTTEALLETKLILEFASVSDGKQGVEKAANLLFAKYQEVDQDKPKFTEALLDETFRLVGCSGPEPDLLLIYGPTRCHLGFPAWRIRYTEMVHMGSLKSKKHGSLFKAIYRFTTVRQNYGT